MSIYLAWSVYKLLIVLAIVLIAVALLWYAGSKQSQIKSYKKATLLVGFIWIVMVFIAAFNIGDRQQSLTRSKFNTTFPIESPAYVPPPPDHIKAAQDKLETNILKLKDSIKENK